MCIVAQDLVCFGQLYVLEVLPIYLQDLKGTQRNDSFVMLSKESTRLGEFGLGLSNCICMSRETLPLWHILETGHV